MITYRIIQPEEVVAFRDFRLSALHSDRRMLVDLHETEKTKPLIYHLAMITNNLGVGAYNENRLIGITMSSRMTQERLNHKAIVWGTYVATSERTKGIAHSMQAAALDILQKRGVKRCSAAVVAGNEPALHLFTKLGFQIMHTEANGIWDESKTGFIDLVHMSKALD